MESPEVVRGHLFVAARKPLAKSNLNPET